MTQAIDIQRIYAEANAQQANEAADARRLSKARKDLQKSLNEEDSCRKRS